MRDTVKDFSRISLETFMAVIWRELIILCMAFIYLGVAYSFSGVRIVQAKYSKIKWWKYRGRLRSMRLVIFWIHCLIVFYNSNFNDLLSGINCANKYQDMGNNSTYKYWKRKLCTINILVGGQKCQAHCKKLFFYICE